MAEKPRHKYVYDGPVMQFGTCIINRWKGETWAPTESRARTNLTYQCKTGHNLKASAKLDLPGKLKVVI